MILRIATRSDTRYQKQSVLLRVHGARNLNRLPNLHRIRVQRGQIDTYHTLILVISKPFTRDLPGGISGLEASAKMRSIRNRNFVVIPGTDESGGDRRLEIVQKYRHIEKRREAKNIVTPKNHLELADVGLLQICALVRGPIVHAADFNWKSIRLRSHQQIGAEAAEFAGQPVAGVERDCKSRRRNCHTQDEGRSGQNLPARIANKGLTNEAGKHSILSELWRQRPKAPRDRPQRLRFSLLTSLQWDYSHHLDRWREYRS